jgi:hypothetical protein
MNRCGLILCAAVAVACADDAPGPPLVCEPPPAAKRPMRPEQCGPTADYTPINGYAGELAVVQEREDAVVMLNGTCTGTLIAAAAGPVVISAGHCVRLGDRPLVVFNFEDGADGDQLITDGTVIEQSDEPDYSLTRLDALPAVTPTPLGAQPTDRLAIIQHPRGRPKVVAEGSFLDSCNGLIYYVDLDTLVGSSGAGVLSQDGFLAGIHTDGDCAPDGSGANFGWTAASIVEASPYLEEADLAEAGR